MLALCICPQAVYRQSKGTPISSMAMRQGIRKTPPPFLQMRQGKRQNAPKPTVMPTMLRMYYHQLLQMLGSFLQSVQIDLQEDIQSQRKGRRLDSSFYFIYYKEQRHHQTYLVIVFSIKVRVFIVLCYSSIIVHFESKYNKL